MASSSPAILPITNQQATAATSDALQSSAVRTFFSGISNTVSTGLSNRRPWAELVDRSTISKPESFSDALVRIRMNFNTFRVNYLTGITVVLAISLLTNPFSLIILGALLAAWIFLYLFRQSPDPLTVFGRQFSERETLLFLIVSSIIVAFLTSVGSVIISALMVGVAIVCLHAAFKAPDVNFLDEQETQAGLPGLFSVFVGAAQPTALSRV